jgi:hypothetical protein
LYVPGVKLLGSTETASFDGVAAPAGLTDSHFPFGGALTSASKMITSPPLAVAATDTASDWLGGICPPVMYENASDAGLTCKTNVLSVITVRVTWITTALPELGATVTVPAYTPGSRPLIEKAMLNAAGVTPLWGDTESQFEPAVVCAVNGTDAVPTEVTFTVSAAGGK